MLTNNVTTKSSIRHYFSIIFIGIASIVFSNCKEVIDDSNFAIKTEMTAADFIDSDPRFSMINALFHRVTLGDSDGASPIYSVLTARGNYTISCRPTMLSQSICRRMAWQKSNS